jgi:dihydrofolate synthase/folylpolyglutamate synthase
LGKSLDRIAGEKAAIIKPGIPAVTAETKTEPIRVMKRMAEKNGSLLVAVSGKQSAPASNLIGTYQKVNAACAVAAIRLAGIRVTRRAIACGLRKVRWPARFHVVKKRPLTIVDGAHNPAGIRVLKEALKAGFPGKKFDFVFGVQKDKDAGKMLKEIKSVAQKIIVTHSSHRQAAVRLAGKKSVPLRQALKMTSPADRVICGSLFLAADALKLLDVGAGA